MLNRRRPVRQQGVVLLMAIVVLVALTLGALALTRSVYTSTVIAGNIAFQRAATNSAEVGIETAMQWLEANKNTLSDCGQLLHCDDLASGYSATRVGADPRAEGWRRYWDTSLRARSRQITGSEGGMDKAGNSVRYAIERMCAQTGDPTATGSGCTVSPNPSASTCAGGSSCAGGEPNLKTPPPVYYRITVLVEGPRRAISLVQAMIAL